MCNEDEAGFVFALLAIGLWLLFRVARRLRAALRKPRKTDFSTFMKEFPAWYAKIPQKERDRLLQTPLPPNPTVGPYEE